MKLFYATSNDSKINNMKRRLKNTEIDIITPKDLNINIDIDENGTTVVENAIKKAKAYYEIVKIPTIAGDSSLFIDGIPDDEQPGLYVRRLNGKLMTNKEMVEYYIKLIKSIGGRTTGYYVTGLALIIDNNIFTAEITENKLVMSSTKSNSEIHTGDPLAVLTIDKISKKYYNELSDEDYNNIGLKFDKECVKFIINNLCSKKKN